MTFEEVTPHLNKITRLKLKNNKRKIGWLYYDFYNKLKGEPLKEILCVNVLHGRKLIQLNKNIDALALKQHSIPILIEDIEHIRSGK